MSSTTPSYDPSFVGLHQALSAWFLGPQAENVDLLKQFFNQTVDYHSRARLAYHPEDGAFITKEIKESAAFQDAASNLRKEFRALSDLLNEKSIPFYSPRYAGHMAFESSLPSILGWLAAILFNPNNVAFEASPITTLLELDAGMQICEMIGYHGSGETQPWGHIAPDCTVANVESMWAARNLKFYPFALKEAMRPRAPLAFIADRFQVHKCATPDELENFYDLELWDLLNLRHEEILSIPNRLHTQFGITPTFLEKSMEPYLIQSTGKDSYEALYVIEKPIQYFVSSTRNYSWPKAGALTGIGSNNVVSTKVDEDARMNTLCLRQELERSLEKQQAVYAVVATIGSTEEGAVDPLDEILKLREEFQSRGMTFLVHADAAWGGYFASMLRDKPFQCSSDGVPPARDTSEPYRAFIPALTLKDHTLRQLEALHEADSITIDPHKSGCCPYPTGGLCYKDGRLRHLVTWTAPYLNLGKNGESIGIYGVEGSKPGAAATSVYLHHTVVGLHKEGHGSLLGEVCFSCARISAHWAAMSDASTPYLVVPLNRLRGEPDPMAIEDEKKFIRKNIIGESNHDIVNHPDPDVMAEMRLLGSDLNINVFACNFRVRSTTDPDLWKINDDVEEANYLNRCIFDRLSVTTVEDDPLSRPMYITSTTLTPQDYGECLTTFKKRLGLEAESRQSLFVLRNVVVSPFQATAEFAAEIAEIFRKTLVEEMEHVVTRNTIYPQEQTFIMQGVDKLFLVYRPLFHKANGRQQLIVRADMADGLQWTRYINAKDAHPDEVFIFSVPVATVDDILSEENVNGFIYRSGTIVSKCTLCNIEVVKHRPLLSKWLEPDYPAAICPFYLYGTPDEAHIEHMLLKAPNAQLTAERVTLALNGTLDADELQRGLLLYAAAHERALQPLDAPGAARFFHPGAALAVDVFPDPFPAVACGPGLAPDFDAAALLAPLISGGLQPLASGTLRLDGAVFADCVDLNREDWRADNRISSCTGRGMSEEAKKGWRDMVFKRMGGGGAGAGRPGLGPAAKGKTPAAVGHSPLVPKGEN